MENKGYISRLDYFMAKNVQKFLEKRKKNGKYYVPVSMNFSRMDFLNNEFMNQMEKLAMGTSLEHDYLRYEFTESAYVNVGNGGNNLLNKLQDAGSKIYIDDFGTGISSLQNLMDMKYDMLKIDMVFVRNIGIKRKAETIIKSAISLSHMFGNKVIAEGVETEEQYRFLLDNDCDYIQGYYFSKPVPQDEFEKMLNEEEKNIA